jgi:integrase
MDTTLTVITQAPGSDQAPELDLSAITRANLQPSTCTKYTREVQALYRAGIDPRDNTALGEYAATLTQSRRAFLKAALRLMTHAYEREAKASATPGNIAAVQAILFRLDAMRDTIRVPKQKKSDKGNWLSQAQVKQITALCGDTLEGKRDWIILGLLLGAGLRREELATLTFDALQQRPGKSKTRHVLTVTGKGDKGRVIPISTLLATRLKEWEVITGPGRIARSLGMKKQLGDSMSTVAIFKLVSKYGAMIGMPALAPHDLRRTFAQLAYAAGLPLTQVSTLLGHSSVKTTQNYLDLSTNLETTASDFIPLSGD